VGAQQYGTIQRLVAIELVEGRNVSCRGTESWYKDITVLSETAFPSNAVATNMCPTVSRGHTGGAPPAICSMKSLYQHKSGELTFPMSRTHVLKLGFAPLINSM
jgi:hypothetical protein